MLNFNLPSQSLSQEQPWTLVSSTPVVFPLLPCIAPLALPIVAPLAVAVGYGISKLWNCLAD
jgi:hypothetical protein